MPKSTLDERVARLEESMARAFAAIERLADKQTELDAVMVTLTESQIRTEERFRETDERFRQTGERIDNLVSAIGEILRNRNGKAK